MSGFDAAPTTRAARLEHWNVGQFGERYRGGGGG